MDNLQTEHSPAVSVVMPAYNAERTLGEAVESILAQTFRDFEFIICNDASTDKTRSVLKNITDKRVRIIHNDTNIGPGPSRDRAIEIACGRWLAFIDADDAWAPERLETLLYQTDASPNKMIFDDILECHDTAHGMVPWHNLRGKYAFSDNHSGIVDVPLDLFVCSKRLLIKPLVPAAFVKNNCIRHRSRPDSKEPVEDTDFFLQLMALGLGIRYIPKPMYLYRITPGSASGLTKRNVMMREVLENAISQFENAPAVQAALQKKIARVVRAEYYNPFVWALKKMQLRNAFLLAYRTPWVIPEFFRRIRHSLVYQAHRILNRGRMRGIR